MPKRRWSNWVAACAMGTAVLAASANAMAEGAMQARGPGGADLGLLPLTHTDVRIDLAGSIETATVTQRFHNARSERIEAVYIFPLPERAAVDQMEMHIGARVIRAEIRRRADAREAYDTARNNGQQAALLEQERPNIFTFSVANIDPGQDVDVTLRYIDNARYDHGTYELAFPMVVGPRYIPGTPTTLAPAGTGPATDTDRVRDASRISTEYLPPGTRTRAGIDVQVHLDGGAPIATVESNSHQIDVNRVSPGTADIVLHQQNEIPNRDFVLRWQLASPTLQTTVFTHRPDAQTDGYLGLMLEPPRAARDEEITPREIFFLLDTSGSMMGTPLETARAAIRTALSHLTPRDSFQLIDFADTASSFAPQPLPGSPANIARATAYLNGLRASGGTNQLAGIHAALSAPGDAERLRYVVFMTDGYIGNEHEIVGLVRREIGHARIFGFGIGSSVNRFLLDEVSAVGRGTAEYLRPNERADAMVARFYERIARPYLTDVEIDAPGIALAQIQPDPLPDLSALQPLVMYARYRTPGPATIRVRGRIGGRPFEQRVAVDLPASAPAHVALSRLWARAKVSSLSRAMWELGESTERIESITQVALDHHIMSAYTSFVAIDSATPVHRGPPVRVIQPAAAPEGVDMQSAGGATFGATGTGWGGGGTGEGTIGLGSIGAIGHGAGTGTGQGYGAGAGTGLRGRGTTGPTARAAAPTVTGALSPEVIRRVVLRNLGAVAHCHELALARNPTLAGRLVLQFVIGPLGNVLSVVMRENAVADPAVGACVSSVLSRMQFPAPPGNASVTVSYPFNFTAPTN